ncbi:hypothetical protein IFM89_039199 [Coptis chinensis]|uniref:Eukaryotic translation initiation factor 3 subunit G n=1 Tax=Coptis chinensis TaxID=261450 RepID=A0A835I9U4_9MAGN|nr:hypothetical protein IFM89_039199 [Coptis chinensis]
MRLGGICRLIRFMGAMISNLAFVFRNIFSKRGMKRKSVGGMNYYACLSMLSLLILTPFAIAVGGPSVCGYRSANRHLRIHMVRTNLTSHLFYVTFVSYYLLFVFFLNDVNEVPHSTIGYVGDDKATTSTIDSDGWLKTAELEHLLQSHPKIADVALIPYHVEEAGQIPMTFVVKTTPVGSKPDEGKIVGDPLSNLGKGGGAVLMVCRTCGKRGDRWTAQCPFKDLAQPLESFVDKPPTSETTAPSSGTSKGAYVPPSQRAGADRSGHDMRRKNDENSVRVTNLSEDTRELDLQDLFSTFGLVSRVYIAYD